MLKIKDLHVSIETDEGTSEILKGLNLTLNKGEIHAVMGPNGSGKSTLAQVLMGNSKYIITKGDILLDGKSILDLDVNERAKKGFFLSFQAPVEFEGITISKFLRESYNSIHSKKKLSVLEFQSLLKEKAKDLGLKEEFLNRYLNKGFSGGEKKKAEILQLLVLNPSIAILDETDSGLDIDSLKAVAQGVKKFEGKEKDKIVLVITHYKRILNYLNPNKVSILIDGKIAHQGTGDLADKLEEQGYGWVLED